MGNTGANKGSSTIGGAATQQGSESIEGFDFTTLTDAEQKAKVKQMQQEMGQTGDEAGKYNLSHGDSKKMYVNCSKSFDINYFLATGKVGSPQSTWTDAGYTKADIEADIAKMDAGMKPLSESVMGYKYADGSTLGRMLGLDALTNSTIAKLVKTLQSDKVAAADFATRLAETDYTHPAYTSMSYVPSHGSYDYLPVRIDFVARKGTKAIVTNNSPEHEIIGARGLKYHFTGKFKIEQPYSTTLGYNTPYQLVIECYI